MLFRAWAGVSCSLRLHPSCPHLTLRRAYRRAGAEKRGYTVDSGRTPPGKLTETPDIERAVQTFLPYPDFRASARALDDRRLGKQRVEALQILRALTRERYGWQNHPATRMWRGYEEALAAYGMEMCDEWIRRGHPDTVKVQLMAFSGDRRPTQRELARAGKLPPWLGDDALHRSHRAALVRKDPIHYRSRFADADPDEPYYWPVPKASAPHA